MGNPTGWVRTLQRASTRVLVLTKKEPDRFLTASKRQPAPCSFAGDILRFVLINSLTICVSVPSPWYYYLFRLLRGRPP